MVGVNWVAIQAIANAALVATSGGAIAYAGRQLQHERGYRSVENLEKQLTFFLSEQFLSARRRLAESRVREDLLLPLDKNDPPVTAFEVLDFYEHLGLLVKKGHLDVYDVWHTFYEWAQPVYVDLQPVIEDEGSPICDQYSDLQKLMRAMDNIQLRRMHAKNANHWALWTPERILDYYRYEMEAGREAGPRRRRREREKRAVATPAERMEEVREEETEVAGRK